MLLYFTAEICVFDCGLLPQAQGCYITPYWKAGAAADEDSNRDSINSHTLSNHVFKCIIVPDPIKGRSLGKAHQMNPVQKVSHTASPQPSAQDYTV